MIKNVVVLIFAIFYFANCQFNNFNQFAPLYSHPLGTQKFEIQNNVRNPGMVNLGSTYTFQGGVTGWQENKPIGKESVYSRPLDMPGGDTLYKMHDKAKHTIYVTESGAGVIGYIKLIISILKGTLEKEMPIYDSSKLQTTSTNKYNVFKSNCQDYTNNAYGK